MHVKVLVVANLLLYKHKVIDGKTNNFNISGTLLIEQLHDKSKEINKVLHDKPYNQHTTTKQLEHMK